MANKETNKVVAEVVVKTLVKALEAGIVPWDRPWYVTDAAGEGGHSNLVSKRPYRGVNQLILNAAMILGGWTSPYWCSFKQANDLGGRIRKGEHGTPIVFYKWMEKDQLDDEGNPVIKDGEVKRRRFCLLRYYRVFNVQQVDGIEGKVPAAPVRTSNFTPIERAEQVVAGWATAPKITYNGSKAYYQPSTDHVGMPHPEQFKTREHYYSTLYHELVHSTGHKDRLGRAGVLDPTGFGSHEYGMEELCAEVGAAMLAGLTGIDRDEVRTDSVAYIGSWLKTIKEQPQAVLIAGGQAQQAVDYITGVNNDPEDEEATDELPVADKADA